MKNYLLRIIRRIIGVNETYVRLERIEKLLCDEFKVTNKSQLEILPGTIYSTVAIPLEYKPSRNFNPRWGNSQQPIAQLETYFQNHISLYKEFVEEMFKLNTSHIKLNYDSNNPSSPAWRGGAICAFDSLAVYTMISKHKPRIYCEIGSGMSTLFAKQAVNDFNLKTKIISIDPEPRQFIDNVCNEIIREPLENISFDTFLNLQAGDILFLDGSHRSFMNSDVTVFFIDILPLIKPGVIIHIHDVFLPYDYPESFKNWYWNEQYLLAVYLLESMEKVTPLLPTAFICRNSETVELVEKNFFDIGENDSWLGGGSFWFKKNLS